MTTATTIATIQMSATWDRDENLATAEGLVREAAAAGANIVSLPEKFSMHFFDFNDWKAEHFAHAETLDGPTVTHMRRVARDLGVAIPCNIFERANNAYYNTIVMIDADGRCLGTYRKSHIPLGPPGCFEKNYISPGDTGFQVWRTAFGVVGAGICWDQWFPEAARIMCLLGADVLFYPTGIGSDCHDHWQTVIRGHAGANLTPIAVSNRVGTEVGELGATTFFGQAFIAGPRGELVDEADATSQTFVSATFDFEEVRELRAGWGVFRDRRPDIYAPLLTLDGVTHQGLPAARTAHPAHQPAHWPTAVGTMRDMTDTIDLPAHTPMVTHEPQR